MLLILQLIIDDLGNQKPLISQLKLLLRIFLYPELFFQFSSIIFKHCSELCPFLKPNKYGERYFSM